MRVLVKWSESSLSMTTPRPENAEPSRCMAGPLLRSPLRHGIEIAGIDRLQTWLLLAEIVQAARHGDHYGRGLPPYHPVRLRAGLNFACFLDRAVPQNTA